jgi:FkbM family methyltransferase
MLAYKDIYERLEDQESKDLYESFYKIKYEEVSHAEGLGKFLSANKKLSQHLDKNIYLLNHGILGIEPYYQALYPYGIRGIVLLYKDGRYNFYRNGTPYLSFEEFFRIRTDNDIVITCNPDPNLSELLRSSGIYRQQILYEWKDEQYFDVFEPRNTEIFVDGGAFNGDTTIAFFKWIGDKKGKVTQFDIVRHQDIDRFKNNLNVNFIQGGLWNRTGVYLTIEGQGSDAKVLGVKDSSNKVESITLNEVYKDSEVTFIKLDIEGSEKQALEGGDTIIRRDKPRLAVALYHKPEDLIVLPNTILGICSDYRLKIRSYQTTLLELVLYAEI